MVRARFCPSISVEFVIENVFFYGCERKTSDFLEASHKAPKIWILLTALPCEGLVWLGSPNRLK